MAVLDCVEIEASGEARASVIWMHGLGADGHDFEPVVPWLGLPADFGARFVFPHAPAIPVTLNQGMVMPAWYDINTLDLHQRHDEAGIRASAERLTHLIERENERGIPCERILLAGFSQGGAIALHTALRHPDRLAGVIGLSTYLVLHDKLEAERSEANGAIPVFMAHGTLDPMVAHDRGQASCARLKELGYTVEWHEYPMMHQVCLEEIRDLGTWIAQRLDA